MSCNKDGHNSMSKKFLAWTGKPFAPEGGQEAPPSFFKGHWLLSTFAHVTNVPDP